MKKSLGGMYAALMTAMDDGGTFSPERQRQLDSYVLGQGLAGLYVAGSSGESGLLESATLAELMAVVVDDARGHDIKLIAHVGLPALAGSIALAKHAEALGYHALSALPPHSYAFSDDEIFGYYEALSSATSLPLIVYEIPGRTGRPLPFDLLLRILDLKGVAGLKFSSMDLFKFGSLRHARPEAVFYFGFDEIYAAAAILGSDGGIGTTYNLVGRLYVEIAGAIERSEISRARELQEISRQFVEILVDVGVMPGMKAAFRLNGLDIGPSRAPMALHGQDSETRIAAFLARSDVKEWLS